MNILQINCVYGVGSTGNITRDLHQALLARGHRSAVLYGRGPLSADPHVARICPSWYGRAQGLTARVAGLPYGRCIRSTRHLLDRICPSWYGFAPAGTAGPRGLQPGL